jgi:hypothetical protein
MMTRKLLLPLVLVGLLFAFGCSNKVRLSGKVTFSDDGSPVPTGTVQFETDTFVAQGEINSDGTYIVGSEALADGIPKGTYRVVIFAEEMTTVETPAQRQGDLPTSTTIRTPLINSKYNSGHTSGLTFFVDGKTKKFDIKVDRAQ